MFWSATSRIKRPSWVLYTWVLLWGTLITILITSIFIVRVGRRPRWLGRLSSCLLKSISWIQFSPSAHTRRDFFLHKKLISGKRESVSEQHSMKIDEQWECWTLCAIKMKARTGGEKGRHLWPRLVQKIAEGETSYELSWKVKWWLKNKKQKTEKHAVLIRGKKITSKFAKMGGAS